jgi:aminoglycoside phosphotransferase (APT) family kinase protein
MVDADARRAVRAARAAAAAIGLTADEAEVLSDSNRLVVRLLPCDVVARVAPTTHFASAHRELEVIHALSTTDAPVAPLAPRTAPRVHEHDGFEITFWAHLRPVAGSLAPAAYADALARLHAGLRAVDPTSMPRFTDRVATSAADAADPTVTPDLDDRDRTLLVDTFGDGRRAVHGHAAAEQVLHGEPHPGNVLLTAAGPHLVDFENATRGPVEYDLAWVPDEVRRRYPGADQGLVEACRALVLAIIATHRWTAGDEHPSGRVSGVAFLDALRAGPPWPAIDEVRW